MSCVVSLSVKKYKPSWTTYSSGRHDITYVHGVPGILAAAGKCDENIIIIIIIIIIVIIIIIIILIKNILLLITKLTKKPYLQLISLKN